MAGRFLGVLDFVDVHLPGVSTWSIWNVMYLSIYNN